MNKLFLDIGNSRIKRALMSHGDYQILPPLDLESFLHSNEFDCCWDKKKIEAIYITSVTSHENLEKIKALIQEKCQLFPIILTAQKQGCGLTSGYIDFHKLGDDRWMSMIGAMGFYKDPLLIVSAGTAMTVDAVMEGKHLGGFIVPGLNSLRAALAMDTAALPSTNSESLENESEASFDSLLATDTVSAILGGTLYMTAAYINCLRDDLNKQLKTQFRLVLTGGNAKQLFPLIDGPCELIPDLVLQGMINIEESVKKN